MFMRKYRVIQWYIQMWQLQKSIGAIANFSHVYAGVK
jgi:hypothetical protein